MQIPFVGPSYSMQDRNWDCQRTVNMYPQIDETDMATTVSELVSVPGLKEFLDFASPEGATPEENVVRGMWVDRSGRLFVVHGSNFAEVFADGTFSDIAPLNSSTGPIQMASNGKQICVVDGLDGYIWDETENTFDVIESEGWQQSNVVVFLDGYFVWVKPDSQIVYISAPLDGNDIDPLDFASAEGSPDNIVAAGVSNGQLWLFGTNTTEVWTNNADEFPFVRVSNGVLQYGCLAPQSVVNLENNLFWLGRDVNGTGQVYMSTGTGCKRVSNQAVDYAIKTYGDVSTSTAYGYTMDGHAFYVINFPEAQVSWGYDIMTGLWHERQWYNLEAGRMERGRGEFHVVAFNKHLVSDYANGKLYEMSSSFYSDGASPLVRMRIGPITATENNKICKFAEFELIYSPGTGVADRGFPDNPIDEPPPKCWLSWSDDGGMTWSNEVDKEMAKRGNYKHQLRWQRLGAGRARVWRVKCSDNTKFSIFGATVKMRETRA